MITFETFVNTLDADQPYLYVFLLILLSSLFVLKLNKKDLSFMLINIALYTIITTTIFYSYTKYEEKKIAEKYIKDMLSLLYDTDRNSYEKFKEHLKTITTKSNDSLSFVKKNITFLLLISFIAIFIIFYAKNRKEISLTSLGRNAYYLIILGLTEIFLTFFVITRIPLPDILNLMDAFIRRREKCSKENVKKMVNGENVKARDCDNFKEDGDTCVVDNTHKFYCNSGRINRSRYVIKPKLA